jgi:hypothetical protein
MILTIDFVFHVMNYALALCCCTSVFVTGLLYGYPEYGECSA